MSEPAFRDPRLPIPQRVADLLSRLSVEEKAGQLTQYFHLGVGEIPEDLDIEALPPEHRAYLQQPAMVEAAITAGTAGSVLFAKDAAITNRLQRLAVEHSRLGIPLLFGFDVIHGHRTIFPVPVALAASWSPEAAQAAQRIAAKEARAAGIHWAFAPMVDIARDPRWGRIVEGAGEDPTLGSAMAAAQVHGFQDGPAGENVLAGPKHFAGYGAARGGRDYDDADVSDSELWNVYFPPFRAAIQAGAGNVMSAYMDLNGVPASGNRWLLTDVLRDSLGFDGFVVSDANAVRSLETQHFAKDLTDAAARALNAGLDMEMCMFDPAFSRLPDALRDGTISQAALDEAVSRVLTVKFRLGLFEHPYTDQESAEATLQAPQHREAARIAAEQSFVLLKNEDGLLPLTAQNLQSVAVIGQLAQSQRDTLGPWVFDHDTSETVTILQGIRDRLPGDATVTHAPGVGIRERVFPSMFDRMDPTVEATPADYDDETELQRAVRLAAESDLAVVVVGQRQNQIGENASTSTLQLPGRQEEQLKAIVATGTPVVLLVMAGRPVDLRWADQNVPAILQVWYPGTRGGEAVAAALFGDTSPAGRLPFTWPRHVGQVPMVCAHNRTFQPEQQDARYWEEESTPLYPFGHGLSYAQFEYGDITLSQDTVTVGDTITVTVPVTNTSDRVADEVVQLYIHQRYATSTRPVRELKGFHRITLSPGSTETVSFQLGPDQLRYWSAVTRDWVQEASTFDVWVGGDSTASTTAVLNITTATAAAR